MSTWWAGRKDALLAEITNSLLFFGADPIDDPGIGELADTAHTLALEYLASDRGPDIHQAANLLERASAELQTADRFRGTLTPLVVRHLRCAVAVLAEARTSLRPVDGPVTEREGAGYAGDGR